tara:strand:- start:3828 stop:4106 length:279 start_codon:yes stop_codon:yes gene_type:complete
MDFKDYLNRDREINEGAIKSFFKKQIANVLMGTLDDKNKTKAVIKAADIVISKNGNDAFVKVFPEMVKDFKLSSKIEEEIKKYVKARHQIEL